MVDKTAKSKALMRALKLSKTRKGTMPARVATLLKKASQGGQDLRMPIMGGVKMPTDDSKTAPAQMLAKSQGKAEVGPAPSLKSLAPSGPTVPQVTGTNSSTMPKVGADMTVQNDPLVKYLKKEAEELKDNLEAMPKGEPESEKTTEDPTPAAMQGKGAGTEAALGSMFDAGKGSFRQKYTDKDQPVSGAQKIVDKVLNRG
jgi:hypothetical protein